MKPRPLQKSAHDRHADQGVDASVAIAMTPATDLLFMYLAEEFSHSHSLCYCRAVSLPQSGSPGRTGTLVPKVGAAPAGCLVN